MPQIRHPLSGAVYDVAADGTIVLQKDGATGRFTTAGQYLEGEIMTADPQLCGWIGGIQLPSRHQQVAEASLFAESAPDEATTAPGGAS